MCHTLIRVNARFSAISIPRVCRYQGWCASRLWIHAIAWIGGSDRYQNIFRITVWLFFLFVYSQAGKFQSPLKLACFWYSQNGQCGSHLKKLINRAKVLINGKWYSTSFLCPSFWKVSERSWLQLIRKFSRLCLPPTDIHKVYKIVLCKKSYSSIELVVHATSLCDLARFLFLEYYRVLNGRFTFGRLYPSRHWFGCSRTKILRHALS